MKWIKKGFIFGPDGKNDWAKHTALTPTPILIKENVIRVFAGFRDDSGVSRIGSVDLDADNPSKVLSVSKEPILNIGKPGAFDDNGVILGDIVKHDDALYMYYVGFQIVQRVKFLAFSGLAISNDNGDSFSRYGNTPVLDRNDNEIYIRAIHSVMFENNVWKVWYASGDAWERINETPYPRYNIRYTESEDGINFEKNSKLCVDVSGSEYRIGRPRVFKTNNKYLMHYTKGTLEGDYIAGYAESKDGINWTRMDEKVGINRSLNGWDSKTLCYPAILSYYDKTYMFYNGNDMGKEGFGYAELKEW